jgi:glycosyltransferase involved in cell wall biosynthesis
MLKVGFIADLLDMGMYEYKSGVWNYSYQILNAINRYLPNEIEIHTVHHDSRFSWSNQFDEIVSLPFRRSVAKYHTNWSNRLLYNTLFLPRSRYLLKHLRSNKFHVVHFPHFRPFGNLGAIFEASREDLFTVIHIHDVVQHFVFKFSPYPWTYNVFRSMISDLNSRDNVLFVANSQGLANQARSYYRISGNKLRVVYPPIDTTIFTPLEKTKCVLFCKSKYGIDKPFIFYFGHLNIYKGLADLVDAVSNVIAKHKELIFVIGGVPDNLSLLKKKITELHLESTTKYVGYIPKNELPLFLGASIMFPYNIYRDNLSMPLMEAMACGVPTTCPDLPTLREIGNAGTIFFPPGDVKSLTYSMLTIIENSSYSNEISSKALEVSRRFSNISVAKEIKEIYSVAN